MSAPSFSSFPPTFSSFPDLEEGTSTGKSSKKRPPREEDDSARDHKNKKGHRSKRDEREQDDHRSSRRDKEKGQFKHRSKNDRNKHDSLEESISNSISSPLYFSDSKGDALNITLGALHSGSVPRYYAISGGRRVLGLSSALSVVTNTGKEVVVAPRDRHKVSQLTDSKTRLVLEANKPRRFVVSEKLASQYEEVDGFIPILRVGDMHTQEYRRINMKGSPKSDYDEPTSDESNSSDEDQDVYTLSSREELLKDLEQRVQQNPSDVSIWLELTVRSQVESQSATNYKAQAEIEVAILSRAFKAHQDNIRSGALWIKYLTACERIWTDAQVSVAWTDAMRQADCPDLTMAWLNWRIRRTASSVEDILQDAAAVFGKRWPALDDEDQDKANLRLLWRIGVFLNQAGYNERAYALFQAEAQLLFKQISQQTTTWEERIEDLEAFWESEDRRVGDIESADRSTLGSNAVSDVFTRWASHESDQDLKHFIPRRVEDGDDDPYSTVLFSDIRPFLVNVRTRHGLRLFRQFWLYFLGLRTPGIIDSISGAVSDAAWAESSFCSGAFIDMLFPQHSQGSLIESVAGALVGCERAYRDSFGIVREWGYGLLCPLEGVLPDNRMRCWETFHGHVDVIRRIFADLRFNGGDDEWDEQSLAFDLAVDPKRATKQCKQLLSRSEHSVRLWGAQARLSRARGKLDEARKVYGMILQTLSEETEESFVLWWDYAEMLWLDDRRDGALSAILRSCGQAEGGNTLAVLRAKRRLEELVANYGADFSKRRVTLCVLRSRMLLEMLSTSALHSTIELGRRYMKSEAGDSWLHEGATMALLVLIYHYTITLRNPVAMKLLRDIAHEAITQYPDNTVVLGVLLESEKGEAVWGRVRRVLAEPGPGSPDKSVVRKISEIWAAGWVVGRWSGEVERVRASLEAAVSNSRTRGPVLWRIYVEFEIRFGRSEQAKASLLRALGECPYNKELYLLAFGPLRGAFKSRELAMLAETMAEKGLRLRGSIEDLIGSGGDDDLRFEGGIGDEEEDEIVERAKELRRLMPY